MFKILKPCFIKVSPSDTVLSMLLERLTTIALIFCVFFAIRSADLTDTFFVQDRLLIAFPACMFSAALWYAFRKPHTYKFNRYFWLCAPIVIVVFCAYAAGLAEISFQVALAATAVAFLILHMLRMYFEFALFKNTLSLIAAIAVIIGLAEYSKERIWMMSNELDAYYFSSIIKGGYFESAEELALFMCAVLPYTLSVFSVRNYHTQKKIFALFVFAFIWTAIAYSGCISAIVFACFCLLATPYMYIGSFEQRKKYLRIYIALALCTLAAFAADRYAACQLAGTNCADYATMLFCPFKNFFATIGSIPLLWGGKMPEEILPCSLAACLYRFGWIGTGIIAAPAIWIFAKAYAYWRTLSIEKWPMALMEGKLSKRERAHLIMKMRHAVLNKSITPEETIRTGESLLGFSAFLFLPVFSNCMASETSVILAFIFGAMLIRAVNYKSDISRLHTPLRILTATALAATAVYCVIIPLFSFINK